MNDYNKLYYKIENILKLNIKDKKYFFKDEFLEANECK
jgi:hypothetical protein